MSTKAIRIIDIAAGILLTAGGVFCLCNQDAAVVSAGILFGLFMLAAGIAEIVVFAGTSKTLLGSGCLLLLFNQWFTLLSLPLLFTLWLLFSGIGRFVSAFDLRALGVRAWGWVLAIGILFTAAGIICMMDPWISVAAVGVTVGLVLILQGVSLAVCACVSSGKEA